ncbi:16705_t:CDS:2 [Acaulospora morrowiae]|uniref:16705_t:CDS:1 n=1 Tax=Acaulospora morrowiae TaxID=94023 RepID=A0A9N8VPP8_9GLOM|nr:16705_t:CDS:2 [Acaulospora morrowiae]
MGYQTLDVALSFPNKNNLVPVKTSILITDTLLSQGNFLIHHFIVNQIKSNKHVVLVGISQILNHYLSIERKLGVNLTLAVQKGILSFVDGLTSLHSPANATASTAISPPPAAVLSTSASESTLNSSNNDTTSLYMKETLQNFYSNIKNIVVTRHSSQDSNVLLIFDDLSALAYSGFQVKDILEFWRACRVLVEKYDGTILTLIHADDDIIESSNGSRVDLDQEIFVKSLIYQSEFLLSVRGLGTGFSRDVSGEITIARGPGNAEKWFRPSTLHYKILDNNVQFFAKGFSQGVL